MRLVTYKENGKAALGLASGTRVICLAEADPSLPGDLKSFLAYRGAFEEKIKRIEKEAPVSSRRSLETLQFLPLTEDAGKYLCLGLNYASHAEEGKFDKPKYPVFFLRTASSLAAHNQPMILPKASGKFDYEAELAVIIGKKGKHIPREEALDYVAGYSCFNDGSIRDYQVKTPQWTIGKIFDATGGFGPQFVSADELPPGAAGLRIQCRLNGEIMQDANTSEMIFGVADIISTVSEVCTLEPGDVIITGTPSGVGFARRPPVWLKAGDVVEVEIEGIGILRNPIATEDSIRHLLNTD